LLIFFGATLFLSAALLFLVQPMIAKMVLPLFGGTPAVWNTCLLFFQTALLAGYATAHRLPAWLGVRRHAVLHLTLLLVAFVVQPIRVTEGWAPPPDASPVIWLLVLLLVTTALPVLALSVNAPLIQAWFARTNHASAKDPYFLYAASNLGSISALLSYPTLIEPRLAMSTQARLWTTGYTVLVAMMLGCVASMWRFSHSPQQPVQTSAGTPPAIRTRWLLLAFVPSSLMLSVTTYVTTDIAAIPLLWVIPLVLYLVTFVMAFARRSIVPHAAVVRISPMVAVILAVVMLTQATEPIAILIPLHLIGFFVFSLVCHGELAARRPSAERLTEFYLWLAIGGVLGGVFNALVAPKIFSTVAEYPLVLVLACLLRPEFAAARKEPSHARARKAQPAPRRILSPSTLDYILPTVIGLGSLAAVLIMRHRPLEPVTVGIMFAIPALITYTLLDRPVRFGLSLGALLLAGSFYMGVYGDAIHRERSFFGVHRVTVQESREEGQMVRRDRVLVHGNTVHGRQSLMPGRQRDPLTYYHRTGPAGQVFALAPATLRRDVAVIGLGAGALAAYGETGDRYVFYEIDPAVVHIARDSGYFTFLKDSPATIDYVLGDARLSLTRAADHRYGIIVLDAFNSDSIPLHLLTREAVALYARKLAADGLLLFHFSHRYLDLQPVLGNLARDAGLQCWVMNDLVVSEKDQQDGKSPSRWIVMGRDQEDLGARFTRAGWMPLEPSDEKRVWTDDFSDVFSVFLWRRRDR
jgi:SAM-dependent methyltransferase